MKKKRQAPSDTDRAIDWAVRLRKVEGHIRLHALRALSAAARDDGTEALKHVRKMQELELVLRVVRRPANKLVDALLKAGKVKQ